MLKPRKRSALRLFLGRKFYTFKRYLAWWFGGTRFAQSYETHLLPNLIYWMTLHTPLTVTERWRHSYDVFPDANRTQPFGSGATCFYNYLDLQIFNGTEEPYQLHVYLTPEYLVGEWRTASQPRRIYEVYEKEHWITQEDWGGYVRHNVLHRKVYNLNHELLDDEYITENHAIMMYQPFLREGS